MTTVPSQPARIIAQREALLRLSRMLAGAGKGGILDDALDVVVGGLGVTRGAVYRLNHGALELVSHLGLPRLLRSRIECIAADDAGFPFQRAAKSRKTFVDVDLVGASGGRLDRAVEPLGWIVTASAPLLKGREVTGVLVAAAPTRQPFGDDALVFLETAANLVAITAFPREEDEPARGPRYDARKTAQVVALGMLAAGFVDDLRGPLGALKLQLREQERLVAQLKKDAGFHPEVEALAELTTDETLALQRANQITTRLFAVARDAEPENVDVGALAHASLAELAAQFDAGRIIVEARIDARCVVFGRREELAQLVSHLVTNAIDACKSNTTRGARRIGVGVRRDGPRIVLTVEDSGTGVAPDLRPRIFDPFFSTKPGNLGLGLTLVKHTAIGHRGHIELAMSDLGGSAFRIVLPSAPEIGATETGRPPSRFPITAPPKPGERAPRILWIDDDEIFLRSIKRALKDHEIVPARTAADAEARLAEEPKPAIVFCDIGLPDQSGHELHRAVAARDAVMASRFVFVTGGVITSEVADYLIASGCPTLLKPVSIDEVRALVEGCVEGEDAASASAQMLHEVMPSTPQRSQDSATPPTVRRLPAVASDDAGPRPTPPRQAPTNPEIPAARKRTLAPEAPDSK